MSQWQSTFWTEGVAAWAMEHIMACTGRSFSWFYAGLSMRCLGDEPKVGKGMVLDDWGGTSVGKSKSKEPKGASLV